MIWEMRMMAVVGGTDNALSAASGMAILRQGGYPKLVAYVVRGPHQTLGRCGVKIQSNSRRLPRADLTVSVLKCRSASSSADKGHLCRHNSHEQDIRI
jgi:hypothetical protein